MTESDVGTTELRTGWRLARADETDADGAVLSSRESGDGIAVPRMPATILRAQIDAGVYDDDLYVGDALTRIDQDLWKSDWWYMLTFDAPAGHERYTLQFDGLSYRAEIWLNGSLIAGQFDAVGSWRRFEFDVSAHVKQGEPNHLAVRIIPERRTPGLVVTDLPTGGEPAGVDLADTWADWVNFHFHGDEGERKSFIPDKNSGIFRRVRLTFGGAVAITHPYVRTHLPQLVGEPGEVGDSAELTVHTDLTNHSDRPVSGRVIAHITREGAAVAELQVPLELAARETHDFTAGVAEHPQLRVQNPDLWWPYLWGDPALYRLEVQFVADGASALSDEAALDFGIREITGHRDDSQAQPQFDNPGSFYLAINGRDYLVRGGAYSPDLFFESNDPLRVRRVLDHAKDLGLNLLRWEGHLIDDGLLELCDREGMPVMIGTMCCGAWERWHEWDDENYDTAQKSIHDTVRAMRAHPAIALWANGSDGLPPEEVLGGYHRALSSAHWQNPVLDTVSTRNRDWSGIHMNGPYTWRSPVYWFMPDNPLSGGSCAEEGNNEAIPLLATVKKMLPGDTAWPYGDAWSMRTGSMNGQMAGTRKAINRRFGGAETLEDLVMKAQIAQYEGVRAQMEAYAARGWDTHKFTVYWMLNSPWPSFFGHIFDWFWGKGGVYYGIKQALRPLTVVFDYFAEGERDTGKITLVNQTTERQDGLSVEMRIYNADGSVAASDRVAGLAIDPATSVVALTLPRPAGVSDVYFVRATLRDAEGDVIADQTYWQAREDDVPNLRVIDGVMDAMRVRQYAWADFTPLFDMPRVELQQELTELDSADAATRSFVVRLQNPTSHIAFFIRAELRYPGTEEEVLPSRYSDNFVTVYPEESIEIRVDVEAELLDGAPELYVEGIN